MLLTLDWELSGWLIYATRPCWWAERQRVLKASNERHAAVEADSSAKARLCIDQPRTLSRLKPLRLSFEGGL
ncbi:MAG: hypothetical protein EA417_21705 [Gammaproteobacteria bacterium]|nr:MAG: hypothetical protein EA417_21705 [Gammaproteobacteria bacterium]